MHLTLALLGSFQARIDAELLSASRAQKIEALLIYLAMESDRPHSRVFLDGLLFPEMPEVAARNNLRQTLMRLRHLLLDEQAEVPLLLLDSDKVQFNVAGDWELDVRRFQECLQGCARHRGKRSGQCEECMAALTAGLQLYRGPFLEGFAVRDSELFESWVRTTRERLQQEALKGCQVLVEYYERRGEYVPALQYARRWLELDSYCEAAHRAIMCLLAWQGQRTAALAQYKRCRQLLAAELDTVPEAETEALAARIRVMAAVRPHNLPALEERSFVGRVKELGDICQALAGSERRLLTLMGPGGIGKTRLALQVGWAVATNHVGPFIDGVYFVSLIGEMDGGASAPGGSLAMTIVQALEIPLRNATAPELPLLEFFQTKECLLILDNCEALDAAGRTLIVNLLQKTRGVQILTTSRRRLNLIWEWVLEIEGLSYPEPAVPLSAAVPEQYEAVQLFIQRARQMAARFSWEFCTDPERAALVRIGWLTRGMPLALELAAVWIGSFSCIQILAEIQKNLDILAWDVPEIPERHRCIRAVFESSWQMLSAEEQRVLAGLSVFAGSFSAEAAEQIIGAAAEILAALRDRSLLQKDGRKDLRYLLHPLLRQFLVEKLSSERAGEYGAAHARYYGRFLAQRREAVDSAQMQEALAEIQADLDNVRDGWRWGVAHHEIELLGEYMHPLYGFYALRAWWDEGRELFTLAAALVPERVRYEEVQGTRRALIYAGLLMRLAEFDYSLSRLEHAELLLQRSQAIQNWSEDPEELALVYEKLGLVAHRRGDYPRAVQLLQFSYQIAQDAGEKNLGAHILMSLGALARDQEEYSRARVYLQESLTVYRAIEYPWGIANVSRLLGYVTYQLGEKSAAQRYYDESLQLCRELKNPIMEALVWNSLGQMAHTERNYAQAREFYERGIALLQEQGDDKSWALVFENLGKLSLDLGQFQEAQTYLINSLEAAVKAQDTGIGLRVLVSIARLAFQAAAPSELRQLQIVELLARISEHPTCPSRIRKEALSLLAALTASGTVPTAARGRNWSLAELRPLGYAALAADGEAYRD